MISLKRYRQLFSVPHVAPAVLASVLGRIPMSITGLAILLFVQSKSGSFALAGGVSALYVLGLAVLAPLLGRLIDRVGPKLVLSASAAIYPAALIALVLLVSQSAPSYWIAVCATVAGAAMPPITVCMRALYPQLLREDRLLQAAYSLDSALIEMIFILG
ncbi:MAG: MFS transporter, partial [Burkholderiales bacterium]